MAKVQQEVNRSQNPVHIRSDQKTQQQLSSTFVKAAHGNTGIFFMGICMGCVFAYM
jgi:hypothetical protein